MITERDSIEGALLFAAQATLQLQEPHDIWYNYDLGTFYITRDSAWKLMTRELRHLDAWHWGTARLTDGALDWVENEHLIEVRSQDDVLRRTK